MSYFFHLFELGLFVRLFDVSCDMLGICLSLAFVGKICSLVLETVWHYVPIAKETLFLHLHAPPCWKQCRTCASSRMGARFLVNTFDLLLAMTRTMAYRRGWKEVQEIMFGSDFLLLSTNQAAHRRARVFKFSLFYVVLVVNDKEGAVEDSPFIRNGSCVRRSLVELIRKLTDLRPASIESF